MFSWQHVNTANGYVINVLDSRGPGVLSQFYTASSRCNFTTNICTLDPGLNLQDGVYKWQMRWIQQGSGNQSAFSPFTQFIVAGGTTLSYPANGRALGNMPPGANYRSYVFTPPKPLSSLRVYNVATSGIQTVIGDGDEDLLVVHPPQEITSQFQLDIKGFRGIYYIGASFDPAPRGTMRSPNGVDVPAVPALLKFQNHRYPLGRPFVYLAKMRVKNNQIKCCDLFQVGGKAIAGEWGAWPDIYRYKMKIDGFWGWSEALGGTWGDYTNHADFMKQELGGVRHTFSGDIDLKWGYQADFLVASSTTNFAIYRGPDGFGEHHYWSYVSRMQVNPSIASTSNPTSFFMARGSNSVATGDYYTSIFHEGDGQGTGVFVVPVSGKPVIGTTNPNSGTFGPFNYGTHLMWPTQGYQAGRLPVAVGRLIDGSVSAPPTVVSDSEVGWQQRVRNLAGLNSYIASMRSSQ